MADRKTGNTHIADLWEPFKYYIHWAALWHMEGTYHGTNTKIL